MSLHEGSPSAAATAGYARGRALADVAGSWLRSRHALLPMVDADDLAARFGALALRRAEWTHVAHLAVGAWHVRPRTAPRKR